VISEHSDPSIPDYLSDFRAQLPGTKVGFKSYILIGLPICVRMFV